MQYYQLKAMGRNQYPNLKNWYSIIEPRYLNRQFYFRLPEYSVIEIDSTEETLFADMLMQPFFMVSKGFAEVVHAYDRSIPFKAAILLDPQNRKNCVYHLPILEQLEEQEQMNGQVLYKWQNGGSSNIHIREDLAESLLRRRAVGMGLEIIA